MKFDKQSVIAACVSIAPQHGLDPLLVAAICLQEGGRNKDGTFAPDRARLEQSFYSRYVEKNDLATTSEVLLSCSYGVMQTMGLELRRMGFFPFAFSKSDNQQSLREPESPLAVCAGIDSFCEHLEWQVHYGCQLFAEKLKKAGGSIEKALLYWNGGSNKQYPSEVLAKLEQIKKERQQ